jgi:hypothetical protein
VLVWAALGVVFGDIGTSPLYAMSETVSSHLAATQNIKDKVTLQFGQYYGREEVLGWTSMFFWAIAIVVTLKYVVLILRADNEGEGGMFSILALLKAKAAQLFTTRGNASSGSWREWPRQPAAYDACAAVPGRAARRPPVLTSSLYGRGDHTRSRMVAMPWPPPMHIVMSAVCLP